MQHFGGGVPVICSVTIRCSLPSPALLTRTIYFPALPPTAARGWPQTRSGSSWHGFVTQNSQGFLPACHYYDSVHSLPVMLRKARLQEQPALRTFLLRKPFLTASRARSWWCRDRQLCQSCGRVPRMGSWLGCGDVTLGYYTPLTLPSQQWG